MINDISKITSLSFLCNVESIQKNVAVNFVFEKTEIVIEEINID